MNVRIRLFAVAKQLAGADSIDVEVIDGGSVADLRRSMVERYPQLAPLAPHILFAIGSSYADDATKIPVNADVACIPPVSGG